MKKEKWEIWLEAECGCSVMHKEETNFVDQANFKVVPNIDCIHKKHKSERTNLLK